MIIHKPVYGYKYFSRTYYSDIIEKSENMKDWFMKLGVSQCVHLSLKTIKYQNTKLI